MTIQDKDIKLLWGRAAGICSRPGCNKNLTVLIESGEAYSIGEMAHVIGKNPGSARSTTDVARDTYDNLILLCPTDHTEVDKAPETMFPATLLFEWKRLHEARIANLLASPTFQTFEQLAASVSRLLSESKELLEQLGPDSIAAQSNPSSNLHKTWELRKLDRILPNNRRIINMIEAHNHIISDQAHRAFIKFKAHAEAYEQHVYSPKDEYPRFPIEFSLEFSKK